MLNSFHLRSPVTLDGNESAHLIEYLRDLQGKGSGETELLYHSPPSSIVRGKVVPYPEEIHCLEVNFELL